MPPVPKRKISSQRQGKRRKNQKISLPNLVPCPNCNQLKKPHQVCPNCNTYKQKQKNEVPR